MPSLRSQVFLFLLKNRNLFRFQWKRRPNVDRNTSIPELRAKTEKAGRLFGRLPAQIGIAPTSIGERYAEWVLPAQGARDKTILYFLGGGYVIGSPQGHRIDVAKVVRGTGIGARW